jgi:hypothetical protein
MRISLRSLAVSSLVICLVAFAAAQQKKTGVLDPSEVKQLVPATYFFDDQVAPVQMRNAVAIRTQDSRIVAAGLVDNSGYSSDVQQKYQGFLVTSKKITIEGRTLAPGEYGFGFTKDGKFRVLDTGAGDVFSVAFHTDEDLKRPVPLKATGTGPEFRLYNGKKYVTLKVD